MNKHLQIYFNRAHILSLNWICNMKIFIFETFLNQILFLRTNYFWIIYHKICTTHMWPFSFEENFHIIYIKSQLILHEMRYLHLFFQWSWGEQCSSIFCSKRRKLRQYEIYLVGDLFLHIKCIKRNYQIKAIYFYYNSITVYILKPIFIL